MKAATGKRSKMLSPAGFGLVLLLFLFVPFLAVSCEVPGAGAIGADYRGTNLVAGAEPDLEVPQDLQEMVSEAADATASAQPAPEPGVQVLALIVALVLVVGMALPFVPRLVNQVRMRMFGTAALAVGAGVLMIVTQLVAQTNVAAELTRDARALGDDDVPSADEIAEQVVHTEIGFWLSLVVLALIAMVSVGYVFRDKLFARAGHATETVDSATDSATPIWQAEPEPVPEHTEPEAAEPPPDRVD
jgi:hypothetical protein